MEVLESKTEIGIQTLIPRQQPLDTRIELSKPSLTTRITQAKQRPILCPTSLDFPKPNSNSYQFYPHTPQLNPTIAIGGLSLASSGSILIVV